MNLLKTASVAKRCKTVVKQSCACCHPSDMCSRSGSSSDCSYVTTVLSAEFSCLCSCFLLLIIASNVQNSASGQCLEVLATVLIRYCL